MRTYVSAPTMSSAIVSGCSTPTSVPKDLLWVRVSVEAGCKTTIGARLKRAGMHWTVEGANAIIALRCCYLSGRFEDFWERRSEGDVLS